MQFSDAVFEEYRTAILWAAEAVGSLRPCQALDLDVKYYNEEYPAVEQCAARDLADKIDVQTCRYVRERVGVWICDKCGHDEGSTAPIPTATAPSAVE